MLFMVPDSDGAAETGGVAAAAIKVELDLDDAPFLEEPEEEAPPPPPPEESAPPPEPAAIEEAPKPKGLKALFSNKKRVAIVAAGLLVLLIAPIGINVLLSDKSAAPVVEAPPAPQEEALPKAPPVNAGLLYPLEGFLVPLKGSEGQIGFLRCRFVVPAKDANLLAELRAKNIVVRDAIYYYLSNKPVTLLSDKQQGEVLKRELISVINEHVGTEKIEELFIEEYLVTGL